MYLALFIGILPNFQMTEMAHGYVIEVAQNQLINSGPGESL
ncbi:hypothetical protein [Neobacillus endophyticus]|nr:hypothetical protein [Neobacillus endophyticus]